METKKPIKEFSAEELMAFWTADKGGIVQTVWSKGEYYFDIQPVEGFTDYHSETCPFEELEISKSTAETIIKAFDLVATFVPFEGRMCKFFLKERELKNVLADLENQVLSIKNLLKDHKQNK